MLLNIDLGERADEPVELYGLAQIASIACGQHAGDEVSMRRALSLCLARGTLASAHPSYPDRAHFGREPLAMSSANLRACVYAQCEALAQLSRGLGATLRFAKAHGALYHAANNDDTLAVTVVAAVIASLGRGVTLLGPARGALAAACAREGVALLAEGFADRATGADGALVPRGTLGAVITDPSLAAARALAMVRSGAFDTLCVHGDTPGSVAIARAVRDVLARESLR